MQSKKQRISYAIFTLLAFCLGILIYFLLNKTPFFKSFMIIRFTRLLIAGTILSSIVSGLILVIRFISECKSQVLIAFSAILFPITLLFSILLGAVSLVPYYVYNLVMIFKGEKIDIIKYKKVSLTLRIILICITSMLVLAAINAPRVYRFKKDTKINEDIVDKTGFEKGSFDFNIIKEFYYDKDKSYEDNLDYQYELVEDVYFTLIENKAVMNYKIEFVTGTNSSKSFTLNDLNDYTADLFSEVWVEQRGEKCAIILIIDARTEEEHRESLDETVGERFSTDFFLNSQMDRKYAEPDSIELYNNNDAKINKIVSNNGNYVMYYDVMDLADANYKIIAEYNNKKCIIIESADIINYKIFGD